ncbi:Calx-beta domain-containing protein [uncultured Rhodospira sp.]|uniref:Calx-beta domain-containing protein n=1 Tax=uncultured Rhodospira sp. TaxID=1936189 RepID=UPI00261C436E|nr:Calx-beta domain-containing protein [uncultured Rhodospira sp.]
MIPKIVHETLEFTAEDLSPWGFGTTTDSFRLPLGGEIPMNGRWSTPGLEFDYNGTFGAHLIPYINFPTLGSLDFSYPVNFDVVLPESVAPGEMFSVETGDNARVANAEIFGRGAGVGSAGVDVQMSMSEVVLSDVGVGNLFGYSLFEFDDIGIGEAFDTTFNLVNVDPTNFEVKLGDLFGGFAEGSIRIPGDFEDSDTVDATVSRGADLPPLTVDPTSNFATFAVDLDKIATTAFGLPPVGGFTFDLGGVTLGANLLDLKAQANLGLTQAFTFDPDAFTVELFDDTGTLLGQGNVGDAFSLQAPDADGGVLEITAKYKIDGDISTQFGLTPNIKLPVKALDATFEIGLGGDDKGDKGDENNGGGDKGDDRKDSDGPQVGASFNGFSAGPVIEAEILDLLGIDASATFDIFGNADNPIRLSDAAIGGDLTTLLERTYRIPYGDGPTDSVEAPINEADGDTIGLATLTAPTFTNDGDVDYQITLSTQSSDIQYNLAFIIDKSGSMTGQKLSDAKQAYNQLINSLEAEGIAAVSQFAVIPFTSYASLQAPLDASGAKGAISGLYADGGTSFGPALSKAQAFFSNLPPGGTNIAYFLSDGHGSGASSSLQAFADVRAFGIGNADLSSLNIIDSNSAVMLRDSSQLADEFQTSGFSGDQVDRVEIFLNDTFVETFGIDQFQDTTLGFNLKDSQDNLTTGPGASNELRADVILTDGTVGASLEFDISGGDGQGNTTEGDDTIRLGAFDETGDGGDGNDRVVGNNLDNTLSGGKGNDRLLGGGGNDQINPGDGDDRIDGGDGVDTVVYDRNMADVGPVKKSGGLITVGTGTDTLSNVEFVQFKDTRIDTNTLQPSPELTFSATRFDEGDTANSVTVTLTLSEAPTADVTGQVRSSDGTAVAGADYVAVNQTFRIEAGATSTTLTLDLLGDDRVESEEHFHLNFTGLANATFENGATAIDKQVAIVNDDATSNVTISGNAPRALEGDPDDPQTDLTFTVRRGGEIDRAGSVDYVVTGVGSNPANAADFAGAAFPTGKITFAPGETSQQVTVAVAGDAVDEPDEDFKVSLLNPSTDFAVIGATAGGRIQNDDAPAQPAFALQLPATAFDEGDSGVTELTFRVVRSSGFDTAASVDYTVVGAGDNPVVAQDLEGGVFPSGTIYFDKGETVGEASVRIVGDTVAEPDEAIAIVLSNPSAGAMLAVPQKQLIVSNDDVGVADPGGETDDGTPDDTGSLVTTEMDEVREAAGSFFDTVDVPVENRAAFVSKLNAFLDDLPDGESVTLTTDMLTSDALSAEGGGAFAGSEGQQDVLFLDARSLESGSSIDLDWIEFAVILGPVSVGGGDGNNIVVADGSAQTIVLGPGDDTLNAGDGDDVIGSLGGNDILIGGNGNDTISGGTGVDVAQFAESSAAADIQRAATISVTRSGGTAVVEEDVEVLVFSGDGTSTLTSISDSVGAAGLAFDSAFYLSQNADVAAAIEAGVFPDARTHFLEYGLDEGRAPNPLWDEAWYLAGNSDVAAAIADGWLSSGLRHYATWGTEEGRDSGPWFSGNAYLEANTDVADAGMAPLFHFVTYGAGEGRTGFVADTEQLFA